MHCRRAADPARPQLKVARVPVGTPGLQLLPMPETRFVPEVPHARVQLDAVKVDADALLPGDGYERYVKPFRSLEDAHVTLAVLAYLLREARQRGWPTGFAERLCATLAVLCDLAAAPADAPVTHVVLAGALAQAHALYAEAGTLWAAAGDDPAAVALDTRCRTLRRGRFGTQPARGSRLGAASSRRLTCSCARCCSARVSAPGANAMR